MSQVPNFDPSVAIREYSPAQWTIKEDYYANEVQKIKIPIAPTPADVGATANAIETLLCLARLDMSFIQQRFETYKDMLDINYKESFYTVKMQQLQANSSVKLTVSDIESIVITTIKNTPFRKGATKNLYEVLDEYQKRYTFINAIVKILCDKKDFLITHNSVLKAEAALSGFSYNNGQRNEHKGGNMEAMR